MGYAEWGGNPVCWWLGLYFCFVCCLDEAFCTGCYWWLGDARSCIQVVSFVQVLSIWYSLGLVFREGNGNPLQYCCLETPMDGGALVGCSPWDCKELDITKRLNWTELNAITNHLRNLHSWPDQVLSLWSGSTDSKTLDYQRTNPREYRIVRTHTRETTQIQDLASPNHQ